MRDGRQIVSGKFYRRRIRSRNAGSNFKGFAGIEEAQQQDRQNRSHRAQRHQTEAVCLGVLVASDGGDTNAHRHDKRCRHRARRHTARIKGDAQIIRIRDKSQSKQDRIGNQQHPFQRNGEENTQHRCNQEKADAHRHCNDQHPGLDVRDILGQNRQVRLRNRDNQSQRK